jgi:hypothetical protein
MELEILILKKATKYASFKMLMGISGKDFARIYKFMMFYKIEEVEGLNFLRKGGVYICDQLGSLLGLCSVNAIFILGFGC